MSRMERARASNGKTKQNLTPHGNFAIRCGSTNCVRSVAPIGARKRMVNIAVVCSQSP